jgi:hypothetical protein
MHWEHDAKSGRLELKIPDLIDRMGGEMQLPVRKQVHGGTASIELVDRHQDEDIRSSSRAGHRKSLFRVIGRKCPDTHLGHRSSDSGGSEAVGVGFDDRTNPLPIRYPATSRLRDRLEISLKSIQIDSN